MHRKIIFRRYIQNLLLALFVTAILAVPVAWWLSDSVLLISKTIRYQHTEFAPIEIIFVLEKEAKDRLGGDFILHPDLFKKEGENHSATINNRRIKFITNGDGRTTEDDCEATVDTQPIGCEEIIYSGGDASAQYFVRLVGDTGITAEQASKFNAPYFQFDQRLNSIRNIFLVLIPLAMFLGIWLVGKTLIRRLLPQAQITKLQAFGLLVPWALGLFFWTLQRIALENFFG